jgi:hypothetical protein
MVFLAGGILSDYEDGVLTNGFLSLSRDLMSSGYLLGGFISCFGLRFVGIRRIKIKSHEINSKVELFKA